MSRKQLSKKDINHLKSVMSKDEIKTRLPYDKRASVLKRRCSFVGSTNNEEFLSDETGNVRWICFAINSINWDYSNNITTPGTGGTGGGVGTSYFLHYHLNFTINATPNPVIISATVYFFSTLGEYLGFSMTLITPCLN